MLDALISLFVLGDYTGGMYTHFGIEEDHWIIDAILTAMGR